MEGLKVLLAAVEVSPYAKVGGLADVIGSLPKALRALGCDARVVAPRYKMVAESPDWNLQTLCKSLPVPVGPNWDAEVSVDYDDSQGYPIYFVGGHPAFELSDRPDRIYSPGWEQYAEFSRSIFEMCRSIDWIPDVIHAHDWHCGFVPVLLGAQRQDGFEHTGSAFTIHNLAYQGEFGVEVLDRLGLPRSLFDYTQVEAYGAVNFLKSGCAFGDQVNTVSPTYAEEIQTAEYGCRLEGLMRYLHTERRLRGIVNGIDLEEFDPAKDPHLAAPYSVSDLAGKRVCRDALMTELELDPASDEPILGMVTRLSEQKGFDLLLEAADRVIEHGVKLVVLGLGSAEIASGLRALVQKYPGSVRFVERFDEPLARRIYAGCSAFLMPSRYEPCGLGQLIAMRYGTLPIARRTGGLADTIDDGRTGFLFDDLSAEGINAAVRRAVFAYLDRPTWETMVTAAMEVDSSWDRSAQRYIDLYEDVRNGYVIEPMLPL